MKSSNKINPDFIFVGVCTAVIITFSALLYADFTRRLEVGDAVQIGTITFKRKVAQRKYAAQVIWEEIEQRSPIYNNDSIRTQDLSEAIINLKDGTKISVDENSLILVALSDEGINIDFSRGSISANRKDLKRGEASDIKITAKDTTVSFGKSDVKLSKTDKEELDLTVTDGTAKIKTGKDETTLKKDEKAVISKDRGTKVVKLNLKLKEPGPNNFVVAKDRNVPIRFSWEPPGKKSMVYLEVADNRSFSRGLVRKPAQADTLTIPLGAGNYYWRLRGVNRTNNKVEYSEVRKLTVLGDKPVRLLYPANKQSLTYSVKPPLINFRWDENKLASEYTLEISKDAGFKKIHRTIKTPLTAISVDNLEKGTYYWRIKTATGISTLAYSGSSQVYSFRVEKLAEMRPPILISPATESNISASMFKKDVMFSWKAEATVRQYDFVLASDNKFDRVIYQAKNAKNFISLRKELLPGTYYWKVGAVSPQTGKTIYSNTGTIAVVAVERITLAKPLNKAVVDLNKDQEEASMKFSWSKSSFRGKYQFELSRDENFSSSTALMVTKNNNLTLNEILPGIYYWRVRLLDEDRTQVSESDPFLLTINKAVDAAEIEKILEKKKPVLVVTSSVKGSTILINGKEIGTDTVTFNPESNEKTAILVSSPGYESYTDTVTVKSGETKKIEALLKKVEVKIATLTVTSSVKGSTILIDGKESGTDTVTIEPKPGQAVNIEVAAEGYTPFKQKITLDEGETKQIYARLLKKEVGKTEIVIT